MYVVNSLTCHRDVLNAKSCLLSFSRAFTEGISLNLFDDGSLTDEDCASLDEVLPHCSIIRRSQWEEETVDELSRYPNCFAYRERFALGFKIFDLPLYIRRSIPQAQYFTYIDSDILFFHQISNSEQMFQRNYFLCEHRVLTSQRPSIVLQNCKNSLLLDVNSGMMNFDFNFYDLPLLEWFFSERVLYNARPALAEQTAWAVLGAQMVSQGVQMYLCHPDDIVTSHHFKQLQAKNIAVHFIASLKSSIPNQLSKSLAENTNPLPPRDMRFVKGRLANTPRITQQALMNRFNHNFLKR